LIKRSHLWYEKDVQIQPRGETINIQHHTIQTLTAVVEELPIGANLALYQFLWMLISGALHDSRGALFPALKSIGLKDKEVRRAWAAMRCGAWQTEREVVAWLMELTEFQMIYWACWWVATYEDRYPVQNRVIRAMMRALKKAGVILPYQKGRYDIDIDSERRGSNKERDSGEYQV